MLKIEIPCGYAALDLKTNIQNCNLLQGSEDTRCNYSNLSNPETNCPISRGTIILKMETKK